MRVSIIPQTLSVFLILRQSSKSSINRYGIVTMSTKPVSDNDVVVVDDDVDEYIYGPNANVNLIRLSILPLDCNNVSNDDGNDKNFCNKPLNMISITSASLVLGAMSFAIFENSSTLLISLSYSCAYCSRLALAASIFVNILVIVIYQYIL